VLLTWQLPSPLSPAVPSKLLFSGTSTSSAVSLLEMQLLGGTIATRAKQQNYKYSIQLWKRDALGILEVRYCRQGALAQLAVPCRCLQGCLGHLASVPS
jgi:hypothetical protein